MQDGTWGQFEKHMKNDHKVTTSHLSFLLAINFLNNVEKDKIEADVKSKVDIFMETSSKSVFKNQSEMVEDIQVEEDTEQLLMEEDELKCSYDGVKIAKENALSTFKNVFFNDEPLPKRPLVKKANVLIELIETPISKRRKINVTESKIKAERVSKARPITCEICKAKFLVNKAYVRHIQKNHNNLAKPSHSSKQTIIYSKESKVSQEETAALKQEPAIEEDSCLDDPLTILTEDNSETIDNISCSNQLWTEGEELDCGREEGDRRTLVEDVSVLSEVVGAANMVETYYLEEEETEKTTTIVTPLKNLLYSTLEL